jgi:hypothetical protein
MPVEHQDDLDGDHRAISVAEVVSDYIVARLQGELGTFFYYRCSECGFLESSALITSQEHVWKLKKGLPGVLW